MPTTNNWRRVRFKNGEYLPFRVLPEGLLFVEEGERFQKINEHKSTRVSDGVGFTGDPARLVRTEQDFLSYQPVTP